MSDLVYIGFLEKKPNESKADDVEYVSNETRSNLKKPR